MSIGCPRVFRSYRLQLGNGFPFTSFLINYLLIFVSTLLHTIKRKTEALLVGSKEIGLKVNAGKQST
jgi:hypothetical protein